MTRLQSFVVVACVALSACNRSAPVSENRSIEGNLTTADAETSPSAADLGDFVIADPIQHENLTIFPVVSKTPRLEDRFMTLEDGLKAGTVEILEMETAHPAGTP